MKLIMLRLGATNKPSLIFESVMEIRINNQRCKGINLTTRHTQAWRAPRVATIHDVTKKPGRVLPHPGAVVHAYASTDIPWVAWTLSHFTSVKWGKVSSNSLKHEASHFGDSICPVCVTTFKCLFIWTQPMPGLIDTGGGYHLEALNMRSDHSPSFPSSILHFPLIARLVSNYANHSIILLNHIGPPSIERTLSRADSNHSSCTDSLNH
jgi:hypothetical protein